MVVRLWVGRDGGEGLPFLAARFALTALVVG